MALKKCAFEGCDETFEPGYHQGRRRFCDIHFVGNTAAKAKKKKRREPATPAATAPADESNLVVPIDLSTSQLDRIWVTFTIEEKGQAVQTVLNGQRDEG
jgi:hypothetical protein